MQHTYDVLIIGAGISGMVAAHTLLEKEPSLDILILEATDRIGGRTLSLPVKVNTFETCLFDFGGHWISSSQVHVKKYIDILKLSLVPQQRGVAIGASNRKSFSTYLEHPMIGHIFTRYEIHWIFAKPFWRLQNYSAEIFACNAGPVSVCYDATKNDNPALMGYINDPTSFIGSDGTCKVKVLEQLVQYWGKEATNIIEYKEIYWRDRPYTGGCPMSCAGLEIMKWHQTLTKPVGRIHWAGTELATEWNGFMNGAIQSGYRAGIETLYDIRPQMITFQDLAYVNTRRKHIIRLKNLKIPKTVQVVVTLVACYYVYKYFIKELLK